MSIAFNIPWRISGILEDKHGFKSDALGFLVYNLLLNKIDLEIKNEKKKERTNVHTLSRGNTFKGTGSTNSKTET